MDSLRIERLFCRNRVVRKEGTQKVSDTTMKGTLRDFGVRNTLGSYHIFGVRRPRRNLEYKRPEDTDTYVII